MTIHRKLLAAAVTFGLALGAVACGDDDATTSSSASTAPSSGGGTTMAPAGGDFATVVFGEVTISDAWARATPTEGTPSAAYLHLESATDDALVGASAPATTAGRVEIHETVEADGGMEGDMDGGMSDDTSDAGDDMTAGTAGEKEGMGGEMTMHPVESIALPAGETIRLEPGGHHIMLLDLPAPLEAGTTIELSLTFEQAGTTTITVPVVQP